MTPRRQCVTIALVWLCFGACARPPAEVPGELHGRWVTADPRFAGRVLEFGGSTVGFETGIEPPSRHEVVAVENRVSESGRREFVVHYAGEGDLPYRLAVQLVSAPLELRLVHRPDVAWTLEGES